MQLECFVLGISGSIPLPNRNLTSVMVRREGEEILFDCGEGMQMSLRAMHIRWKNLKVVCISHSHADHVTGLPGLLMLSSQANRTEPLLIICPLSVKHYIESSREHLGMYINYDIHYVILDGILNPLVYEDAKKEYCIKAFEGEHTRDVWFFVLEEYGRAGKFYPEKAQALNIPRGVLWAELQKGNTIHFDGRSVEAHEVLGEERQGRKIAYVTDTRPLPEIEKEIANADMVFCESMFQHIHHEQAVEKKHMTSVEAAQMLKNAGGIKRAGLVHVSPRYIYKDLKILEREAQDIFDKVFLCKDRESFTIPYC